MTARGGTRGFRELPSPNGTLVGRAAEIATLVSLVARPEIRVVTVTGPSGVGKTRLVQELVARVQEPARVLVPLASVADPQVMGDAIAHAVSGRATGARRPANALWRAFAGEPVLLLLDNLEQIPGAGAALLALQEEYPGATVLGTSLRPLGMQGEQVLRLRPLPTAPDRGGVDPGGGPDGGASPAVRMFVQCARAADATFAPDAATLADVDHVCGLVGGLPLAIELAAARVASVPPRLAAAQMAGTGGLSLLRQVGVSTQPRHGSLEAALEWTCSLLDPAEVDLFAALSVFCGPATLEAASAVAAPSLEERAGPEVMDLLSVLVDAHLVDLAVTSAPGPLFLLLPPVRAFAAGLLARRGRRESVLGAHDVFVRARARSGAPLHPEDVADALATLDRARLAGATDTALDLALHAALAAGSPGLRAVVRDRMDELLEVPGGDQALRARALLWTATQVPAEVSGREAFAVFTHERVEAAIRTARMSGDTAALLDALELTVRTLPLTLDKDLALAGVEEGLSIAERCGDAARSARFRMWTGMAARSAGHTERARSLLLDAFRSGRLAGDGVAADYAAMFLRALGDEGPGAGTSTSGAAGLTMPTLPALPELLEAAWVRHDSFAAGLVLSLMVRDALEAGDVVAAARFAGQMLPIALECSVIQPVVPMSVLAHVLQVLVAAGSHGDAGVIAAGLGPLDSVMRNSMAATEFSAYLMAARRLRHEMSADARVQASAVARALSLGDLLRHAERAVWSVVAAAEPRVAATAPEAPGAPEPRRDLTAREREVLSMLAEGGGNREIASRLGIAHKTVMHHTVSIYRKLGVRGRTEAAAWAIRSGLAEEDAAATRRRGG